MTRLEEADEILKRSGARDVFVEVETTGLSGRNGCRPEQVAPLVHKLADLGMEVHGLMTVGPPGPPEGSRDAFRTTAVVARDLGLREISMGMSDDLEVAAEEGATVVRVGRALFGEREAGRRVQERHVPPRLGPEVRGAHEVT